MLQGKDNITEQKVSQRQILDYCILHHIPFAIFKMPGESKSVLLVCNEVEVIEPNDLRNYLNADGYLIAPFSFSKSSCLYIKADYVIDDSEKYWSGFEHIKTINSQENIDDSKTYYATFEDYQKQFAQLYQHILDGDIRKAILSRIKPIKDISKKDAGEFYYTLCSKYPKAYTFMYYTPQSGLWSGASPELFLKIKDNHAYTVSLAGTRNSTGDGLKWNDKEVDEQQIVTDFVTGILNKYGVHAAEVKGPDTIKAGKIAHLRTQYHFGVNTIQNKLGDFIMDLHPTPAVCGLPKTESMQIIHDVEKHNRAYYAGFIGRVNTGNLGFFVNIRSMKLSRQGVDLYLGGGITEGSNAKEEWDETELKAETLMEVIREVRK